MITKEHETKIKNALEILDEVRNDLKRLEKEKGWKAPKGNAVRFSIDSVFEDENLGFIYKHGLFEEEEETITLKSKSGMGKISHFGMEGI